MDSDPLPSPADEIATLRSERDEFERRWRVVAIQLGEQARLFEAVKGTVEALEPAAKDDQHIGAFTSARWAVFNAAVRLVREATGQNDTGDA